MADPMSASGLDAKIAALLQQSKPAPADVEVLLAQVEAALADTERELAQATAQALDPTSTSAVIASARGVTFDAQFRLQRLVAARDRLGEKHQSAVERVAKEAREAEYAAISAERDRAAARLSEVYARAAAEIADVLDELVQANRRISAWNGTGGPIIDELPPVNKGVRLPPLGGPGEASIWPPVQRIDAAALVPVEMMKFAAARGAEAKEAAEVRALWDEAARMHPQRRRLPT
jgi:hypothetical protein